MYRGCEFFSLLYVQTINHHKIRIVVLLRKSMRSKVEIHRYSAVCNHKMFLIKPEVGILSKSIFHNLLKAV